MVILVVVFLALGVVVLVLVLVLGVVVVVAFPLVVVPVLVPRAALAHAKEGDPLGPRQLEDIGVFGEGVDRLDKERLELVPDPDHEVRVLEGVRVRRSERPRMRRSAAPNEEGGLARSLHHPREQGVDRFDARHRGGGLGGGCYSRMRREGRGGNPRQEVARA